MADESKETPPPSPPSSPVVKDEPQVVTWKLPDGIEDHLFNGMTSYSDAIFCYFFHTSISLHKYISLSLQQLL
jgi:hypothetical protein